MISPRNRIFKTVVGSYPIVDQLTPAGVKLCRQFQSWDRKQLRLQELSEDLKKAEKFEPLRTLFDYQCLYAVIDQLVIGRSEYAVDDIGINVISTGQPICGVSRSMTIPYFEFIDGIARSTGRNQTKQAETSVR